MSWLNSIQSWLYGGAAAQLRDVAAGVDAWKLVVAMAFAGLFGVVHAFMPGHGKTVIVSYYLGRPSRLFGSIGTSAVLVLTHVGSAILLVLAGFAVLQRTIGGAGRAPAFEIASAALIVGIGLWLLVRALRPHHHAAAVGDARALAFATGLVPCPLTTFIMVYAAANGILAAGLLVTTSMALGMLLTIALFAVVAVLLRERVMQLLERTEHARERLGRGLEVLSAITIIAFGAWLLAAR